MQAVKASIVPFTISESCSNFKSELWACVIKSSASGSLHPVGNFQMRTQRDTNAVVDCKLRVRGIEGLRDADASLMPEITSGNTMVPTIMIGEKAAEMIKQDYIPKHNNK